MKNEQPPARSLVQKVDTPVVRRPVIWMVILFALSAFLRWKVMGGDFWLDEIWSLNLAKNAHSLFEIIFRLPVDNNHPLNTLFLHFLYPQQEWSRYRMLSFASGLGLMAFLFGKWNARSRFDPAVLMLLWGTSAMMVLYSTEARGYAPAAFCAVAAISLLENSSMGERPLWMLLSFWFLVSAGMLSHATFAYFYGAVFIWDAVRTSRDATPWRRFAALHVVPLLGVAGYSFYSLQYGVLGGGNPSNLNTVLLKTAELLTGAPDPWRLEWIGLWSGIAVIEIACEWIAREDLVVFNLSLLILAVGALAVAPLKYERYLFLTFPFVLRIFAQAISRCLGRRGIFRAGGWILLAIYVGGQLPLLARLVKDGRGHYLQALQFIADQTATAEIALASDHDFRNGTVIDFYRPYVKTLKPILYFSQNQWSMAPEWFVVHRFSGDRLPGAEIDLPPSGAHYHVAAVYRSAGLPSGWTWIIYRRRGWALPALNQKEDRSAQGEIRSRQNRPSPAPSLSAMHDR